MPARGSSARCHEHGHQPAAIAVSRDAQRRTISDHVARCTIDLSRKPFSGSFALKASNRDSNFSKQQLLDDVPLLPALGSGRIARAEQLKQRELYILKSPGSNRRATVNVAKLLTNQIAAAASLEQLHEIVTAHGNHLAHIHVAKLLSRTSQLSVSTIQQQQQQAGTAATSRQQTSHEFSLQESQQQQLQQLLYSQLIAMMVQRLRHATAQSFVAAAAAIGRMSSFRQPGSSSSSTGPTVQQLQQLASKALDLAPEMSTSQLAVVLWGFAKAGYRPGQTGSSSSSSTKLVSSSSTKLVSSSNSSSSRSWLNQMLAAVMLQYDKAYERQQRLLLHKQQQQQGEQEQRPAPAADDTRLQRPIMPHTSKQQQQQLDLIYHHPHQHSLATDLSLVMYAVAVMGQQPTADWVAQWQQAVALQLPNANAQDISQLLWSMSSLGLVPEVAWLHQVLAAAEPLLPSASSHATSNIVWALSWFNQPLPDGWMAALLEAVQQDQTLASNPQALSSLLASLARLRAPLEPSKLISVLEQTMDYLPVYTPWQLTNTVWACASFNSNPSAAWTRQFLRCTAKLADAGRFTVSQLASIIWSLAVLRRSEEGLAASQQLQLQVMLNALAAANNARGLQLLGAAGRSTLAWALATLSMVPSRPWLAQFLSAAFNGGLASDRLRCANVLFCVASLDFEYLVEWLGEFLAGEGDAAAAAGGLDLSLEKYVSLAAVLAALSEMDSKQLRAAWLDISSTEWSPDAAIGEGAVSNPLQLPPALSVWVDNMLVASAAATATAATTPMTTAARHAAQDHT